MLIIDNPYISDLLKETCAVNRFPVLRNEVSDTVSKKHELNLLDTSAALDKIKSGEITKIYSNSENALAWLSENMRGSALARTVEIFKDKARFRREIASMFREFSYRELPIGELRNLKIDDIRIPFIIKPSVGFFSIGVYKVESIEQWPAVVKEIENEIEGVSRQYPDAVVKADKFIIEDFIEGEELAIDVYYNEQGKAVILDILHHIFSSGKDVKDRVYKTSKDIIEKYYDSCNAFLNDIGRLFGLKNFPMHIELRIDENGFIVPIEVNPLRFAGWCTTDIAYYAYGINIYEYFLNGTEPRWDDIFRGREDKIYSLVIADLPDGISKKDVRTIDYDGFFNSFNTVLHKRIIEDEKYSVFAFAFVESNKDNIHEVDIILTADLSVFLELNR